MELDARLLITLGGMLISVITSFVVVRQKCIELEEDSKAMQKNITELYDNLEKNNIATEVSENRVAIISQILSPENREKLHRSLERMETRLDVLEKSLEKIVHMHNGKHPPVEKEN
jgi:SMC interacting uncharacterized protein involved in chromosome segregation